MIDGPDGPMTGAATQRRRLALLALLAASEHGVTRDQLVAFLWPDSGDERARHALAQLLYTIRRELGEEVIQADGVALRVNGAILASDVADFRAALDRRDLEGAVEHYRGSFLDGFFLSGCDDFERWVEETRADLARRAREALQQLATEAAGRDELATAVEWWRRVVVMAPLDSRAALSLMKALAAVGDSAGALEHARVHEALVQHELGAPADPSIAEYVTVLKSPRPLQPPRRSARAAARLTAQVGEPAHDPSAPSAGPSRSPRPFARRVTQPSREMSRRRIAVATTLGFCALAVTGAVAAWRSSRTPPDPRRWVVIADVENATGDRVFERTVPVALAAALAQSSHVYAMPPDRVRQALLRMRRPGPDSMLDEALAREVAQREGVGVVAVPSVERSGDGFELSVRLEDARTGAVLGLSSIRAASRADVLESLDKLGKALRRGLGESKFAVASSSTPLPRVTTPSLEALKRFADGAFAFNGARYDDALALFTEATTLDSAFAAAHASLGLLSYWLNKPTAGAAHYARALALAKDLPEREQVRIRAAAESWRGNREGSIAILRPYLAGHPDDIDLWSTLAYDYLRLNRDREAEEVLRRIVALDSLNASAWVNLATTQKGQQHYADAVASYRRALSLMPSIETANNNVNLEYAGAYVMLGQTDSARAVMTRQLEAGGASLRARALRSLAYLDFHEGLYDSARVKLAEATRLLAVEKQGLSEIRNRMLLAHALEYTGREREAAAQLTIAYDRLPSIDAETPLLLWLGKALARAGDVRRAEGVLRLLEKKAQPDVPTQHAALEALRGEVLAARGDSGAAVARLRDAYLTDSTTHLLESLAHGFAVAGALDSAVAYYTALGSRRDFGWEGQLFPPLADFWLGRVEERRGNVQQAEQMYRRFVDRWMSAGASFTPLADARERLTRLRVPTDP